MDPRFKVIVADMNGIVLGDFVVDHTYVAHSDRNPSGWEIDTAYIGEEVVGQIARDMRDAIEEDAKAKSIP